MLHEIDAVLRAALPDGVAVSFATPDASWAAAVTGPTVNLFLCRVTEDPRAREGSWTEHRDERGRVVGRQPPPRRYRASYLLTAWDADTEAEHALLGSALTALAGYDMVPAELLGKSLGQPVTIDVGHPELGSAMPAWDSLGIRPRACLDVVVTVIVVPMPVTDLAEPPDTVDLGIGAPARSMPNGRAPSGVLPRKRVRERS